MFSSSQLLCLVQSFPFLWKKNCYHLFLRQVLLQFSFIWKADFLKKSQRWYFREYELYIFTLVWVMSIKFADKRLLSSKKKTAEKINSKNHVKANSRVSEESLKKSRIQCIFAHQIWSLAAKRNFKVIEFRPVRAANYPDLKLIFLMMFPTCPEAILSSKVTNPEAFSSQKSPKTFFSCHRCLLSKQLTYLQQGNIEPKLLDF